MEFGKLVTKRALVKETGLGACGSSWDQWWGL
jgi:hypothetical protein